MNTNRLFLPALLGLGLSMGSFAQEKNVSLGTLPFSPTRQAGDSLYVSGQVARAPDGSDVKTSIAAETRQVMENIGRLLKRNGYDYEDIVSATVYLTDIRVYAEMNGVYASFFQGPYPSRACVGGVELVLGFKVEISCIAYKKKD